MNYYTATIPPTLAEKLKEKGMPAEHKIFHSHFGTITISPTYADCLDWLMSREVPINIRPSYLNNGDLGGWQPYYRIWGMKICPTWHEAANAAIEKAITLI